MDDSLDRQPQLKARYIVLKYIRGHNPAGGSNITQADVYVVWFSKALQNWKALLSTTRGDGVYYEVIYNGDAAETYVDVYRKFDNVCIPDGEIHNG